MTTGDSKSPQSGKKLTVSMTTTSSQTNGTGESDYKPNSITPLSPSRSDPLLESSMKSTTSDHTPNSGTQTGFSSSIAIPVSSKRDQQTLTSPSLENRSPLTQTTSAQANLPTYQQYAYGSTTPPVHRQHRKSQDVDPEYERILRDYDIIKY